MELFAEFVGFVGFVGVFLSRVILDGDIRIKEVLSSKLVSADEFS